jgi:2-C-methyl-D-erythritol 4-phosphate cytidylyltransferase
MKKSEYVSVIIVAAGQGTRMNMDKKKQYIKINGETVLSRTIRAFEESELVDEIILVVNGDEIFYCKNEIIDAKGYAKVSSIVAGGHDRQESVFNGLKEVGRDKGIVLIHDGARPFIDNDTIENCIEGAIDFEAVCAAVPVKDTVKTADKDGFIAFTLDRSILWAVQTPQAFRYELIAEAHETAIKEGFRGTDDAVLVERLGKKVKLVMGSYENIKITTQEDLLFAEAIARELD